MLLRNERSALPAFTLIEVMIVVAILGVVAALAVPALGPMKHQLEVEGVAEQVASFLGRARSQALAQRRCVRVRITTAVGSQPPAVLVAEALNAFDCDVSPQTAPHIDGTAAGTTDLWLEFARLRIERENIRVEFHPVPPETAGGGPGSSDDEIRYRPTGRLWAPPTVANPGDGVVRVSTLALPASVRFKEVLLKRHGPICVHPRGTDLSGGPTWSCP